MTTGAILRSLKLWAVWRNISGSDHWGFKGEMPVSQADMIFGKRNQTSMSFVLLVGASRERVLFVRHCYDWTGG
jgi:hypothetical protein